MITTISRLRTQGQSGRWPAWCDLAQARNASRGRAPCVPDRAV